MHNCKIHVAVHVETTHIIKGTDKNLVLPSTFSALLLPVTHMYRNLVL